MMPPLPPVRIHFYLWANGVAPLTISDQRCEREAVALIRDRLDRLYDQSRHRLAKAVAESDYGLSVCIHAEIPGSNEGHGTQQNFRAGTFSYWEVVDRLNEFWLENRDLFAKAVGT